MSISELYFKLENQYWLEPTSEKNSTQNMKWLFYQPANNLDGLFVLEYTYQGQPKKESGKYSIEMIDGQPVVKIGDAEFNLGFRDNENVMLWYPRKKSGTDRVFERLITPETK